MYAPITVTSEEELLTGPAKLTFEFVKAGDMRGVGHPYVSGMPVGAGDIPRVVFTVAPDEEVQEPFERID